MKNLILIRHSHAESGSYSMPDFNRKLTPEGRHKADLQALRLRKKNIIPDLIITSSAHRAMETTQIFSNILNPNCPNQKVSFLYEDFSTREFFDLIAKIDKSYTTVFLIGHNPTLSVMASRLDLDASISFKPCSIGIFEMGNDWNLAEVGQGLMCEFIP